MGADGADEFDDAAAGGVVVEDGQIAEFGALVFGADHGGAGGGFFAAHGGDFFGAVFGGAAVARGHGDDGDAVAFFSEESERAAGEDLHVVGVGVNGKDVMGHACFCFSMSASRISVRLPA